MIFYFVCRRPTIATRTATLLPYTTLARFSQFLMGQDFVEQGAYDFAIPHYRRAIRLLPNQPQFHRSLADAYQKVGKDRAARRARHHALSLEQRKHSQQSIPNAAPDSG